MKLKNNENKGNAGGIIPPAIFGSLLGMGFIIILLCIFALIMSLGIIPVNLAPLLASVGVAIGGFLGGLFAAKKSGKNGIFVGAVSGIFLFTLFSIFSLIVYKTAPGSSTLIRAIIFIISASIGGILGVSSTNKRKIV